MAGTELLSFVTPSFTSSLVMPISYWAFVTPLTTTIRCPQLILPRLLLKSLPILPLLNRPFIPIIELNHRLQSNFRPIVSSVFHTPSPRYLLTTPHSLLILLAAQCLRGLGNSPTAVLS